MAGKHVQLLSLAGGPGCKMAPDSLRITRHRESGTGGRR